MSNKYYISTETHSIYWIDPTDNETLMFAPINQNNTFMAGAEGDAVDEELFGDEHIHAPETQNFRTFSDVYAEAREALKD